MNVKCRVQKSPRREKLRNLFDRLIHKTAKKACALGRNKAFLQVMLEENGVRRLYRVSVTLELPKTLATQEPRHDTDETIRDAFAEIERQLDAKRRCAARRLDAAGGAG